MKAVFLDRFHLLTDADDYRPSEVTYEPPTPVINPLGY